ncbi:MAG: hypothetical protein LBB94_01275 [Clostridiales bacterium]|nr:hypothetical protein [Clostridiales bacterium]
MAKPLSLTPNEKLLFDELTNNIQRLRKHSVKESDEILLCLAAKAHELHMSLKMHGQEPTYHSFILKNREFPVEEVTFFRHIHPIEDLLAFIQDPDANNETGGLHIGSAFIFPIYVSKQRRYNKYK